jgi:hypothetical protein
MSNASDMSIASAITRCDMLINNVIPTSDFVRRLPTTIQKQVIARDRSFSAIKLVIYK